MSDLFHGASELALFAERLVALALLLVLLYAVVQVQYEIRALNGQLDVLFRAKAQAIVRCQ